jgi:5-methyltetrahydropteroyltriglutamate--homocysteine methyltransferase
MDALSVGDIRAEHVGSLLRPPQLQQARARYFAGQLDAAALEEIENDAIISAIDAQRSVGVDVYTDGEFRRVVYMTALVEAVDGFTLGLGPKLAWRSDPGRDVPPEMREFALPLVTARLRQRRRIAEREAAFTRKHAQGAVKVTLPSPAHFSSGSYQPGVTDRSYPRRADLTEDVAAILAAEAGHLAAEGVGYIQVDAPTYSVWVDPDMLVSQYGPGVDPDALFDEMTAGDNAILDAARAAGAHTAVHICRGNGSGAWLASGGYEPIAEKLFSRLRCDRLLLEYDTDRAGDFRPLRFVPPSTTVVLGLVSTKWGALEAPDDLLRRIDDAARFVPLERLALSPQCGFASIFLGNPLTADEQWRKLELVVSVARQVWG